jgi:hypothetical protein
MTSFKSFIYQVVEVSLVYLALRVTLERRVARVKLACKGSLV